MEMPEDELLAEAAKWEIAHGGLSGRCAQQFVDFILGKEQSGKNGSKDICGN